MTLSNGRVTSTVALLALTVWIGGLLALGAVVAPILFAAAPYAVAADAMTLVFKRYDKIAMACAAIVLVTEVVRARASDRYSMADTLRALVTLILAALAAAEGLWITPKIADLHASGVVRGVGEAGEALASAHGLAETLGKGQAYLAIALIALHVFTVGRVAPLPSEDD